MFCPNCGTQLNQNDNVCPNCGKKIEFIKSEIETKDINRLDEENPETYASGFARFGAYLIDFVILFCITFVVIIILAIIGIPIYNGDGNVDFVGIILGWLYFALQESSNYQATVGQRALKLKVVDYNFEKISFLRATGRHFAQLISILTFMIGYLMIFFTKRRQALHDMIAKTLVIKS